MPTLFDLAAILMVLSGTFGYLNKRYIGLPSNAGLLVLALVSSILVIAASHLVPGLAFASQIRDTVGSIDFNETLMEGMLGFLLFAGALHVDWQALKSRSLSVGLMATLGVLLSTLISGAGFYYLCQFAGIPLAFSWALVFGALISPTDPVAVLATLKTMTGVPKRLEIDMAGESLFNDGVGVVVFTILLAAATGSSGAGGIDYAVAFGDFAIEALGGAAFGALTGYVAYRMMLAIDDYPVEVLISIGLVMGTYAAAHALGMSGPIAVVVAGLLIGERGVTYAMSDTTQRYLHGFWTLIDDILNAVLFMLIGLEFLVIDFDWAHVLVAIAAIPLLLFSRLASVYLPFQIVRLREHFSPGIVAVLTWGGIRGGISVALALSLPDGGERDIIVTATYAIVVFSVLVQGMSLSPLIRRVAAKESTQDRDGRTEEGSRATAEGEAAGPGGRGAN
ncbi:sodium:proton antiporter [Fulvimarina endophytica]|uniref:Sodium:proton antiporter n=1 Tax=Fulvimarina endophytica TaxID=2293836 RepID=A0A371X2J4_9HYPH|nr:sodium:proton antiporter [Fulvimarina endophytica]RFC63436.1 sodium:proton antiporter [Fulvimarina endophytica]